VIFCLITIDFGFFLVFVVGIITVSRIPSSQKLGLVVSSSVQFCFFFGNILYLTFVRFFDMGSPKLVVP